MSKVNLAVYKRVYDSLVEAVNAEYKEYEGNAKVPLVDWMRRRRVELFMIEGLKQMIRHSERMISRALLKGMKVPADMPGEEVK